jgi:hypothetical protein
MPNHVELPEAKMPHESQLVGSESAECVVRSIRQAFRLGRVAITTQIGTDNGEVLRELRGDARPHGFVLRKAVQ